MTAWPLSNASFDSSTVTRGTSASVSGDACSACVWIGFGYDGFGYDWGVDSACDNAALQADVASSNRIEIKIEGDRQVFIAAVLLFGRKPLGHQYFKIIEVGLINIPWQSIVLFAY